MKKYAFLMLSLMALYGCRDRDRPDLAGESGDFIRVFGTAGPDLGDALVQTADSGFALAGTLFHEGYGEDMVLIRTDADGVMRWRRTYGGLGNDRATDMLLLPDGGFLLVGMTSQSDTANLDAWVVRTDADGIQLWERSYGGSGNEEASSVHELAGGGFAIAGYTSSFDFGGSPAAPQFYLLQIDAFGNVIWQKGMGGPLEDRARSVDIAPNGDWLIAGITKSATRDYEVAVLRVTSTGDSIWTFEGVSPYHDEASAVLALPNGETAWLGFTFENNKDYNLAIGFLNSQGFEIAGKGYRSTGHDNDRTSCNRLYQRAKASSIVFVGHTQSKGAGANDIYLVVVGEDGVVRLDQAYGGSNDDIGAAVIPTLGGGYAIVGYSKSFNFNDNHDIVFLKTDASGSLAVK
jgi:hypothetical protein